MRLAVFIMLLAVSVNAQSVFITANTINDLNPQRDALTGTAGQIRITHTISDGDGPMTILGTVRLKLIDRRDNYTNSNTVASYTNQPGTLVWVMNSVSAGTNWLLFAEMVKQSGETNTIFERWLTVTSTVVEATQNFYITNTIISTVNVAGVSVVLTNDIVITVNPTAVVTVINNNNTTNIIQLDNITSEVIYSNNYYFNGLGYLFPYTNLPASPVTIDPTNGWWQTLTATGATQILLANKTVTNEGASVRLDFRSAHSTTITNIEGYASLSLNTNAGIVNVLLFDSPSDRPVTNWIVEQLYP